MKYRTLGTSGLDVSALSFGAWQLGDPGYWGPDAQADGEAAVHAAIDVGINLFDTAESYGGGESERALGRTLGGKRDRVLIASKVSPSNCAPDKLRASCEASLQRLGTDVIDLYQVHWPCRDHVFADVYAELARLRDEGKIRAIGVSNFGPRDLAAWLEAGEAVSNQLGYNLIFRAVEHEIVPTCRANGIGVLAYMPLMQGLLACRWHTIDDIPQARRRTRHFAASREGTRHGEPGCEELTMALLSGLAKIAEGIDRAPATVALAWLLAQPGVASAIVGGRNPAQVNRNLDAVDLELDIGTLTELDRLSQPLKQHFGTNADMWLGDTESRIQ